MRPDLDDPGIRRYLLGLLPEAEVEALEEAYLAHPGVWERVRGVENDLLDDYASDRLDPGEKGAFESRYLASPPLRARILTARALRLAGAADRRVPAAGVVTARRARWGVPLAIAAGLLLAVAAFWIRPPRPPQMTSASAPPTPSIQPTSTAPAREPVATPMVVALSPVLLRGQERPVVLHIPPATDTVVLELEGDPAILPPSPSALQAIVKTVEGGPVWRGEVRGVAAAGRPSLLASARVPAAKLVAGDYLLTLSARGADDDTLYNYFFRVRP